MEEKISENSHFTDTGSTVFVDSSNNSCIEHESCAIPAEDSGKIGESQENHNKNGSDSAISNETAETDGDFCSNLFSKDSKSAFSREFPDINPESLKNRKEFQDLLGILNKNPTLAQIYACFNAISSQAEANAEKRVLQALANAKSSVGALCAKESGDEVFFTKEQVLKMSREDIKRNLTRIKQSQSKW